MIIRPLVTSDYPALEIFCNECKKLGWKNNESFAAMKIDKTVLPYGQYFIAEKDSKIISVAGIHRFPEIGPNAWRCLFRGAQLPGHVPKWSMKMFESGIQFSYLLYEQIKLAQSLDTNPEFYITTNVDNLDAGASSRLNRVMMPRLEKQGYWTLSKSNASIYNTLQNVWKINIDNYLKERDIWLSTLET